MSRLCPSSGQRLMLPISSSGPSFRRIDQWCFSPRAISPWQISMKRAGAVLRIRPRHARIEIAHDLPARKPALDDRSIGWHERAQDQPLRSPGPVSVEGAFQRSSCQVSLALPQDGTWRRSPAPWSAGLGRSASDQMTTRATAPAPKGGFEADMPILAVVRHGPCIARACREVNSPRRPRASMKRSVGHAACLV